MLHLDYALAVGGKVALEPRHDDIWNLIVKVAKSIFLHVGMETPSPFPRSFHLAYTLRDIHEKPQLILVFLLRLIKESYHSSFQRNCTWKRNTISKWMQRLSVEANRKYSYEYSCGQLLLLRTTLRFPVPSFQEALDYMLQLVFLQSCIQKQK